jgi:hypothetical protein
MKSHYESALEMAAFNRRQAHAIRKLERVLQPQWINEETDSKQTANRFLREAINWIQIAKLQRQRSKAYG